MTQATSGSPLLDAVPALHLGLEFGVVKGLGVVWEFGVCDLRVTRLGLSGFGVVGGFGVWGLRVLP